jgi:hypothetical protein
VENLGIEIDDRGRVIRKALIPNGKRHSMKDPKDFLTSEPNFMALLAWEISSLMSSEESSVDVFRALNIFCLTGATLSTNRICNGFFLNGQSKEQKFRRTFSMRNGT